MNYSNKLNLDEFFFNVRSLEYVIIKKSEEFPNYYKRSDVDIFCSEGDEFARIILEIGNKYITEGFEIKVENSGEKNKIFIDFCFEDEINFRFDICTALPNYSKIRIKPFFFYSVIDRRKTLNRKYNNIEYSIFVTSIIDELILRYFEYLEWYELRPDKVKHLHYIEDSLNTNIIRERFFNRLSTYTELPENKKDEKFHLSKKIYRSFIFSTSGIRNTPLKQIPHKVLKRLKKYLKIIMRKI